MSSTEVLNTSDRNRTSIRLRIRLFLVNDLPTILVLFLWFAINIGLFVMRFLEYHTSLSNFYLRVLISDGVSIARGSALCLNFNCLLILLPVCRNLLSLIRHLFPKCSARSSIHRLTIRLFDQHIEFHRCVGYAICFWTLVHVGAHVYNYERLIDVHNIHDSLINALNQLYLKGPTYQLNPFDKIQPNMLGVGGMLVTIAGSTGLIICICLLLMVSSSTALIRRSYYEIFWYIHHLFIIFFIGLAVHGLQGIVKSQTNIDEHNPNMCSTKYRDWGQKEPCTIYPKFTGAKPSSWMWICGPLAIYSLERLIRFIRGLQKVDTVGVIRHESNVLELRFRKASMKKPQPGQFIYVKCYPISKFEWHPFTVTSAAEEDFVSVHIRTVGNWTKELAQRLANYPENVPRLGIDGPYGSPADDVFNYDGVILVGAGIGVTPYAAILKHIRSSQASNTQLRRVYFYWICNTTSCYEWFGQMLKEIERELRSRKDFLTYKIYLTQWSMSQARAVVKNNTDQRDIWTGLEAKTQYGRPNFEADFQAIINEDWNITKRRDIGVFVCGPEVLSNQLQRLCIKMNDSSRSKNQAQFYLNKENF